MGYSIGQVAEIVGLTTYTLRYYEKEGLLPQIKRNENGIRVFSEDDIFWIDLVRCLRDTEMQISDIKYIINLSHKGEHTIPERKEILQEHRKKIVMKINELQKYIGKIDKKLEWYERRLLTYKNL